MIHCIHLLDIILKSEDHLGHDLPYPLVQNGQTMFSILQFNGRNLQMNGFNPSPLSSASPQILPG